MRVNVHRAKLQTFSESGANAVAKDSWMNPFVLGLINEARRVTLAGPGQRAGAAVLFFGLFILMKAESPLCFVSYSDEETSFDQKTF